MILPILALTSLLTLTSPDHTATITIAVPSEPRHRLYDHPHGGLEWEITLVRPVVSQADPVNVCRFTYPFTSANLIFVHQDTLTTLERRLGAHRPDSVVGSWAVYDHHSRKLWHIFRPKAWDSAHDTTWCSLDIDTLADFVTLSVPSDFLAQAEYPVTIDPHFGVDQIGASTIGFYDTYNYALALDDYQHTAGAGEVVDSLALYFVYAGDSAAIAVYAADSLGTPVGSPIGQTARFGSTLNSQWVVVDVNIPLTAGIGYTIGLADLMSDGTRVAYDSYANACSRCTGDSFCDPWSESSRRTYLFSAYAVYTTTGETPSHCSRRRTILKGISR